MTKIKICGLTRQADVAAVNAVCPDYIGFVFVSGRRRTVSRETAASLRAQLDRRITPVGVFIDAPIEQIGRMVDEETIQMVQLHGSEDDEYIAALRRRIDVPILRAFVVRTAHDLQAAQRCPADHILLDSGTGSGQAFDWSLLKSVSRPYFLAGGLSPDNIKDALALSPFAVDASSGLETNGCKDPEKIRQFVHTIRQYTT